jgi:hypothetical protein
MYRLSPLDRWAALAELESLRRHAERTGELLRPMIDMTPELRDALDAYCHTHPEDAADIRKSLAYRDFMLERL